MLTSARSFKRAEEDSLKAWSLTNRSCGDPAWYKALSIEMHKHMYVHTFICSHMDMCTIHAGLTYIYTCRHRFLLMQTHTHVCLCTYVHNMNYVQTQTHKCVNVRGHTLTHTHPPTPTHTTLIYPPTHRHTERDRFTHRQKDRHTDTQTGRQTDRQSDR